MPTPRKNESEKKYVSRCVPQVIHEGGSWKSPSAASGKCYGMYRSAKRKSRRKK